MKDVMRMTRKVIVLMLEHINKQKHTDSAFEAKLHGFKMSSPFAENKWDSEEDERMTKLARERYEKMMAQAKEPRGN